MSGDKLNKVNEIHACASVLLCVFACACACECECGCGCMRVRVRVSGCYYFKLNQLGGFLKKIVGTHKDRLL